MAAATLFRLRAHHLLLVDVDSTLQTEGQRRLSRDKDFLIASETGARSACSGSGKSADKGAFSAAGESANDGAEAGAAADKSGGALSFALFHAFNGARCYLVGRSLGAYGIEAQTENGAALEVAERLGVNDRSGRGRAGADDGYASYRYRSSDAGGEGLSGLADF